MRFDLAICTFDYQMAELKNTLAESKGSVLSDEAKAALSDALDRYRELTPTEWLTLKPSLEAMVAEHNAWEQTRTAERAKFLPEELTSSRFHCGERWLGENTTTFVICAADGAMTTHSFLSIDVRALWSESNKIQIRRKGRSYTIDVYPLPGLLGYVYTDPRDVPGVVLLAPCEAEESGSYYFHYNHIDHAGHWPTAWKEKYSDYAAAIAKKSPYPLGHVNVAQITLAKLNG